MRICNRACHHQASLVSIPPVPSWSNCQHGALTQENNWVFQTRNPQEKKTWGRKQEGAVVAQEKAKNFNLCEVGYAHTEQLGEKTNENRRNQVEHRKCSSTPSLAALVHMYAEFSSPGIHCHHSDSWARSHRSRGWSSQSSFHVNALLHICTYA